MHDAARIASRRVYEGRVLNLDIDRIRFPDGSEGELEVIRHPGASAVVPLLDDPRAADPRIVLLRQYRYAAGGFVYEIPAGRLEQGESPVDCARRELEERDRISRCHYRATSQHFDDTRLHRRAYSLVRRLESHAWATTPRAGRVPNV